MKKKILISFIALFLPAVVSAATVYIAPSRSPIGVGDSFVVPITLDTNGENINAFEGDVQYPVDTLALKEIRDGNSIISLWLEPPADANGTIYFAGITPGGYAGDSGELFTLVFKAIQAGNAEFSLRQARMLRNDGSGSEAHVTVRSPVAEITTRGSGPEVVPLAQSDATPPEPFTPAYGNDPSIADGKGFVVFATQDKQSGIDHYEVAEKNIFPTFFFEHLDWRRAISPYVLPDQSAYAYVYVKAIDKAGNVRVSVLSPEHLPLYYNMDVLVAILMILALSAWLVYARHRKPRRFP